MVQVMPSGLVMTLSPEYLFPTAMNFCCPVGPPHVTDNQLSELESCVVQAMPSGLVMTRLPVPEAATATNFCCPVGPPHVTDRQSLSAGEVCVVQVMPSAWTLIVVLATTVAIRAHNVMMPKSRRRVALILYLGACTL